MSGSLEIESLIHALDGDLVVVNKPSGIPTTGHSLDDVDCVQYHLIQHFGTMVWAVHQLDADTSGVCLFSRSKVLVKKVKARWSEPETQKVYLAVVEGRPDWESIEADFPIGELSPNNLGVCAAGRVARTSFRVLSASPKAALIRATLHTGRTHQIRIHLSHLGHPLIGEKWYRSMPSKEHFRQALHAYRLSIPVVIGIEGRRWTIPLANDLNSLLRSLDLDTELA